MKLFRVFLVFMFAFNSTVNAQEVKAKRVKNKKSTEHVNITGTTLYLKVPDGYEKAVAYIGWNNKQGSSIVFSKRPLSIKDVSAEIDQQMLSLGYSMKADQKEQLLLNGEEAVYFETKNDTLEKKFLLIKGKDFTYIIEGFCAENIDENKFLKKAVLSAFVAN